MADSADELPSSDWGSKPDQGVRPGHGVGLCVQHEESVRCFEKALGLDPDLAIAVGHRVLRGPEIQRGLGRIRPGRAWKRPWPGLARSCSRPPMAARWPHAPASVCDDSGKFNRSVETVPSARRTVSTTLES